MRQAQKKKAVRSCFASWPRLFALLGLTSALACASLLPLGCSDATTRHAPGRRGSQETNARAASGQGNVPSAEGSAAPAADKTGKILRADGLVEVLPSVFGRALVFDEGPWRCIAINRRSSVQSCVHRRRPLDFRYEYVELLMAGALAAETPKRGVLLGLGGAGIAHLLHTHEPDLKLDVVEIDQAVVTLAGRHFRYSPRAGERAFVEDAARFVARPEERARHDLVIVDCFGETFIPAGLLTEEFFMGVRALLSPQGVVVANLWSNHPKYPSLLKRYRALYPRVWVLHGATSGNSIVIAGKVRSVPDPATLYNRARQLDARKVLPFQVAPHMLRLRVH